MVERETTVIKTGGSGMGFALFAIAIIIAAVVAFMFLSNDTKETNAVTGAAESVGAAADSVGSAVKKPAE
ncbi:hypothetical protein BH10PLA2_BH10PLA2_05420 [soil metagenome]